MAGSVGVAAAVTSTVVGAAIGAGLALLARAAWPAGALVVVAAALAALAVVGTARRRVGGITGDVLGAVVEVALAAGLAAAALLEAF